MRRHEAQRVHPVRLVLSSGDDPANELGSQSGYMDGWDPGNALPFSACVCDNLCGGLLMYYRPGDFSRANLCSMDVTLTLGSGIPGAILQKWWPSLELHPQNISGKANSTVPFLTTKVSSIRTKSPCLYTHFLYVQLERDSCSEKQTLLTLLPHQAVGQILFLSLKTSVSTAGTHCAERIKRGF